MGTATDLDNIERTIGHFVLSGFPNECPGDASCSIYLFLWWHGTRNLGGFVSESSPSEITFLAQEQRNEIGAYVHFMIIVFCTRRMQIKQAD